MPARRTFNTSFSDRRRPVPLSCEDAPMRASLTRVCAAAALLLVASACSSTAERGQSPASTAAPAPTPASRPTTTPAVAGTRVSPPVPLSSPPTTSGDPDLGGDPVTGRRCDDPGDGRTDEPGRARRPADRHVRRGTADHRRRAGDAGWRAVLVIGVIHGDEDAGIAIVDRLATAPVPPGVDLWLIASMNPDGQAAQQRWNAAAGRPQPQLPVPVGTDRRARRPGVRRHRSRQRARDAGHRRLREPVRPVLGLWYHQDLYRVARRPAATARSRRATAS